MASPVLMIMGPTATGKTALAIEVAQRFNGEIISVDSALVYRGMDIGTAKPNADELAAAPHHLIDICDPRDAYSAAAFRKDALDLIEAIHQRGKLPILVGGTMLYYRALIDGIAEMPESDETVRAELESQLKEQGAQALHDELARVDPTAAARIHVNDPQRLLRALEVYRASGQTLTSFHEAQKAASLAYPHLKIALIPDDRERHRDLVAQRYDQMLEQGFLAEVRQLYQREDLHLDLPSIRSVGYRQAWLHLQGEYTFEEMRERAIIATRQLAKRQMTWLRKEPDLVTWNCFEPEQSQLHMMIGDFVKKC